MPPETPVGTDVRLASLQRWMQEVVVHPGSVMEAIASPSAEREIPADRLGDVVLPSHSLTAAERVGIYHGMYMMRMEEALAADYPLIRRFLGERAFAELVRDYVQSYPSRSYTLNRLGDHLPRFLAEEHRGPNAELLSDLARFELAMTEVYDEQESPTLGGQELAEVPPDAWGGLSLRPIAALRMLELRFSVVPHLEAYHRDHPSPRPRRRATWIVVYRRDYSVSRLELSRAEHDTLRALVSGLPLAEALADPTPGSARHGERVFRWFRTWIGEGLFAGIDIPTVAGPASGA